MVQDLVSGFGPHERCAAIVPSVDEVLSDSSAEFALQRIRMYEMRERAVRMVLDNGHEYGDHPGQRHSAYSEIAPAQRSERAPPSSGHHRHHQEHGEVGVVTLGFVE